MRTKSRGRYVGRVVCKQHRAKRSRQTSHVCGGLTCGMRQRAPPTKGPATRGKEVTGGSSSMMWQ